MIAGGSKPLLCGALAAALFAAPAFATPADENPVVAPVAAPTTPAAATPTGTTTGADPVIDYSAWGKVEVDPAKAAVEAALGGAVEAGILSKRDAKEITAFYASRGFAPAWIKDGKLDDDALALMLRIAEADSDGLDPADYPLPDKGLDASPPASLEDLAAADIQLSQAVVAYARNAYAGRVNPPEVSKNYGYDVRPPAAGDVLGLVSGSENPVATLEAYNPPQKEFADLRAELARIRNAATAEAQPEVPDGPLLKPGMSDARLPVLRARLEVPAATVDPEVYDEETVAAVEAFQSSAGLTPDGMVGKNTVLAMNKHGADPVATILVNMERWRWMPRYLGEFYVRVNIPNYNLDVYRDDAVFYTTRIVVGKVTNQTPIFSDEIEHIVVNPAWNVPASIVRNELLPAVRNGSGLRGYQVYANIRGRYRAVDARTLNWRHIDARKIQIRQPPGARNALGQVKFLFPNKYDVYLHDTPSKGLFQDDSRAFSHGCMRVMNPWDFADALLSNTDQVTGAALKKMVGGGERWVNLDQHVPVHITYFTAWVDDSGALQLRPDIYGHDKRLAAALGLT